MLAFVNFLRLVLFPLGLALLYGFGEFRRSIAKSSPRTKAVVAGVFWAALALPILFALNACAQHYVGAFLVGSFGVARRVVAYSVREPISSTIVFYPISLALLVCGGVYRRLVRRGRDESPPTDAKEERTLRISAALATGFFGLFFIFPLCAILCLFLSVVLPELGL